MRQQLWQPRARRCFSSAFSYHERSAKKPLDRLIPAIYRNCSRDCAMQPGAGTTGPPTISFQLDALPESLHSAKIRLHNQEASGGLHRWPKNSSRSKASAPSKNLGHCQDSRPSRVAHRGAATVTDVVFRSARNGLISHPQRDSIRFTSRADDPAWSAAVLHPKIRHNQRLTARFRPASGSKKPRFRTDASPD